MFARVVTMIASFLVLALACSCNAPDAAPKPVGPSRASSEPGLRYDFESLTRLPADWTAQGSVSLDNQNAFEGKQCLLLSRTPDDIEKPCTITTAGFPLSPGVYDFSVAARADLKSPDNSFKGVVTLEFLDAAGKEVDSLILADLFGTKRWETATKRAELPELAVAVRYSARLDKASGRFWLDALSAHFVSAIVKKDRRIERIVFATAQTGNLIYPEDPRTVTVTVDARKPLADSQHELTWVLRDYWGAEVTVPAKVALGVEKHAGKRFSSDAVIDFASAPLEPGRYYELYAELPQLDDQPFGNYTALAVLPKPVTKNYQPEQIPFTSRNWEGNIEVFFHLADRIGLRISNIWGGVNAKEPYTPTPGRLQLCQQLGMGVIAGCPMGTLERHTEGWEKITDDGLRAGVRKWFEVYGGKIKPLYFSLGNEPPVVVDRLPRNVTAYKALYEEIKKCDPKAIVLASSVGPAEEYFQAGVHQYCDVVDFHGYSDWQEIPLAFERYQQLFEKYGHKKPIWSTEIGLNSHGLTRQTVAATLVKKITSFFASGGACVSWFDLGYPDPDLRLADDSTTAHNTFDCRYERYCPKLDGIAYYNMINGICIKKFVEQKKYDTDTYAFLFRDQDGHCLQVIWKEKGRRDALVALPGVGQVTAIAIDGRRTELDAGKAGLTLTIDEDPLLLLYDSAEAPLAATLGSSETRISTLPQGVVKGGTVTIDYLRASTLSVEPVAPAFWRTKEELSSATPQPIFRHSFTAPENTLARQGDILFMVRDATGVARGLLRARIPVTGRVGISLLPQAAFGKTPAGVRVRLQNYAAAKQNVSWKVALAYELPMVEGHFDAFSPKAPSASFAGASEGTQTLEPMATTEVVVPLTGLDSQTVYRVVASATDASGRMINTERPMGGFLAVPKAKSVIKLDGSMSEPDWKNAPVARLDEERQLHRGSKEAKWKGTSDLSATMQFLWDEKYLYVGVKVVDDVFCNTKTGDAIWAGDGLQFMVDPQRERTDKVGKYDIAMARTKNGHECFYYLSADARAPAGPAKDVIVSSQRGERGNITYVVAIPWHRIAPFTPAVGANLGLCLALNEDDGPGRISHLDWFADVENKLTDTVGDLILGD